MAENQQDPDDDSSAETLKSLIDQSFFDLAEGQMKYSPHKPNKNKDVAYIYSHRLLWLVSTLPKFRGRSLLVHKLISSYGLISHMNVIDAIPATEFELRSFHSESYLTVIKEIDKKATTFDADDYTVDESLINEDFGIGYDCPAFPKIYEAISHIAGSSLTAAKAIVNQKCFTAINWFGGWHHAHNDEASGYCYVNDIVIAILYLLQNGYQRILYLDLDLHHGDAVENAFSHTSKVMTVSFHKYELGFFPGTGSVDDIGTGSKGTYYSVNVPLKEGVNDERLYNIFQQIVSMVKNWYSPELIICQLGADTLVGDPMNSFNLTLKGIGKCVETILQYKLPLILLGGGGYNFLNTARLWTYITSLALKMPLNNEIPDHCFFLAYRPSYELQIEQGNRRDLNTDEYIDSILKTITKNLEKIKI